ncbi:MAG: DUF1330 domain-containing protein [Pseudomonadota bacterium]
MSGPILFVSIGTPNPDEAEALEDYAAKAPSLLMAAGAVPKVKAKLVEQLVGEGSAGTLFVAEFPSAEAVKTAFASEAYQALLPARNKAFKELNFFIMEAF